MVEQHQVGVPAQPLAEIEELRGDGRMLDYGDGRARGGGGATGHWGRGGGRALVQRAASVDGEGCMHGRAPARFAMAQARGKCYMQLRSLILHMLACLDEMGGAESKANGASPCVRPPCMQALTSPPPPPPPRLSSPSTNPSRLSRTPLDRLTSQQLRGVKASSGGGLVNEAARR